jgi:hypothetical protein
MGVTFQGSFADRQDVPPRRTRGKRGSTAGSYSLAQSWGSAQRSNWPEAVASTSYTIGNPQLAFLGDWRAPRGFECQAEQCRRHGKS